MLVLSRKPGQRLLVPQCGLVITVVAIRGGAVRLGIAAPDDLKVFREEVWERDSTSAVPPAPRRGGRTRRRVGVALTDGPDC